MEVKRQVTSALIHVHTFDEALRPGVILQKPHMYYVRVTVGFAWKEYAAYAAATCVCASAAQRMGTSAVESGEKWTVQSADQFR